ncbi:MAG: DNA replication/repair protein RecF [Chloroflexota bacterium]|nr:DNA replication/repair protein RecF [Chloroflexota bacterium]
MHLTQLRLRNFRNYRSLNLSLEPGLTVLHGQNAQGKTNVLEAVCMLSLGSSYRTASDREVICWSAEPEDRLARIEADVRPAEGEPFNLELLVADLPGFPPKRAFINRAGKRVSDLPGRLTAVFFGPEQLDLVIGSPHHRREFLDTALSQIDRGYQRSLGQYARVLHQRNQLLKQSHERELGPDELLFWDEQMVEHGGAVMRRRAQALVELGPLVEHHHRQLARRGELSLEYDTKLFRGSGGWRRLTEAPSEEIAAEYRRLLALEHDRELAQGASVVGPHRDDAVIQLDEKLVDKFGSRGQQRTTALALKLAELDFLRQHSGEQPVLLLDDVLSELDVERRRALMASVAALEQVLLTTTEQLDLAAVASYEVRAGELLPA